MRLLVILAFLFIAVSAQSWTNDQAMTMFQSPTNPATLQIVAAIIIDDLLPLRIDAPPGLNNESITTINTALTNDPRVVDVFHPSILDRFFRTESLSIGGMRMTRIGHDSFRSCSFITFLNLLGNRIEEIPAGVFRNCGLVRQLNLNGNLIRTLHADSFLGLNSIWTIQLSSNQITTINSETFARVPTTQTLWLSLNPLIELGPRSFPPQLLTLILDGFSLTTLHPETFHNLTQLNFLTMDSNPISFLPPGVFSHLTSLRSLGLGRTNIRRLNTNSFGFHPAMEWFSVENSAFDELQPGFFDNFPNLREFNSVGNLCLNGSVPYPGQIDFNENTVLHRCFANWFVPRP